MQAPARRESSVEAEERSRPAEGPTHHSTVPLAGDCACLYNRGSNRSRTTTSPTHMHPFPLVRAVALAALVSLAAIASVRAQTAAPVVLVVGDSISAAYG